MTLSAGSHGLWPTPIGVHRYPDAAKLNPLLVEAFAQGRAAQERKRGSEPGPFFASDDDLLHRVKIPEWQDFVRFIVASLGETVKYANAVAWGGKQMELKVGIEGMWFQCSQGGAFHDVHTHGNCSWSSAYIVQIDETEQRITHPVYGAANGVTRLYGPPSTALGGAFVDVGNAYLRRPTRTSSRSPGSSCCSRRGSRIRRCPTTATRSGSSSPSTPASTRRRATSCTTTARPERRAGVERRRRLPARGPGRRRPVGELGVACGTRLACGAAAGGLVGEDEVVAAADRVGMLGAEDALEVGHAAARRSRSRRPCARPPGRRARGCCGCAACWGGRRPRALAVGEQRLEDRDRVVGAVGVLVGRREVVAGVQRVGVLGAERRELVLERAARGSRSRRRSRSAAR